MSAPGQKTPGLKSSRVKALGIIETRGRAPLIEAVDAAIKGANVELLASYFVGGGCNTVTLTGDVGAVRAALDAAQSVIDTFGIEGRTHLIPRPDEQVWLMIIPKAAQALKTKDKLENGYGT